MAVGTLQGRLTSRLLVVLVVALLASALASIFAASNGLDTAEESRCAEVGKNALDGLAEELGEGNSLVDGATTVLQQFRTDHVALAFAGVAVDNAHLDVTERFAGLPDGASAPASLDGHHWRGCVLEQSGHRVVVAVTADGAAHVLAMLIGWTLLVLVVAIVAGGFAIRVALRSTLESVARLAAWSERVAHGESSPLPSSADATTEIEQLRQSIDHLVTSLAETLARERANSAHIAHEMRTPLTAIRAELAHLSANAALSAVAVEAVARVQMDIERLSRVIDSVLVLSSSAGRAHAEAPINLADLAREVAARLGPSDLAVELPDEAMIDADENLLALALTNLFENAAKYGQRARLLRLVREGDGARLSVIDAGAGLDETARTRMFDRYWRASNAVAGSGIGLALVRAVAERHGGRADARNARPSDGGGLDVGFTVAPVLEWYAGSAIK